MNPKVLAEILKDDDPWRYAAFEGAVELQLKVDARTSLAEKLDWLEEARRLVRQLEEARKHARPIDTPGTNQARGTSNV